jgi:mannose-6-phosphate isomerase-like protein (cupin superfamily)
MIASDEVSPSSAMRGILENPAAYCWFAAPVSSLCAYFDLNDPVFLEAVSMEKVNIRQKMSQFNDHWNPRIVGDLNGQHVKLVKFQGEFVWHHHDDEDELFLVVKGRFRMDFHDRQVWLDEGEFLIVPRGVEHRPVAPEEVHVLLFEPASTLNTGNVSNALTVREPTRI